MEKLLEKINSSSDVKKLNISEIEALAQEIREFLVDTTSKCGGHLSSNLGAVELTLALHKVFDFDTDKIVWDVGHQSYTHKIITGRQKAFASLRHQGGISGFPKTSESETDAFNTGHSSTSISAVLGFAKAFQLEKKSACSVAVIGDGALTGGMAYEALNHAGHENLPLIVVLNDNGMSIAQNVGGLSKHLESLRVSAGYLSLKTNTKNFLRRFPRLGRPFGSAIRKFKRFLKKILLQKKLFENMGLDYIGPVNGHDLSELITVLEYAKTIKGPVIVHAMTKKGCGYTPAEVNPCFFHGVSGFDPKTGIPNPSSGESLTDTFGQEILRIAMDCPKLLCITAAMSQGTGLEAFSSKFPDRFFDVGIAEQHAVTFSAALAKSGFVPVFAVYSTFLQRGYDQILHDVALQNLHVVFAIDHAGAVGNDGETHQGIYDLSYLSHIPNMTIMAPSSPQELRKMLRTAVFECTGPVAIRYPKSCEENLAPDCEDITIGKGIVLREGTDALLVALGTAVNDALSAAKILEKDGVSAAVLNARFLKPFDEELFREYSKKCKVLATIEDNVETGGLYSAVSGLHSGPVIKFAFPDAPLSHASRTQQKKAAMLDGESIAKKIKECLGDNLG